jgi:hypothetical protein
MIGTMMFLLGNFFGAFVVLALWERWAKRLMRGQRETLRLVRSLYE